MIRRRIMSPEEYCKPLAEVDLCEKGIERLRPCKQHGIHSPYCVECFLRNVPDCEECEGSGQRSFYENDGLVDCIDCGGTGKQTTFPTSEEAKAILAEEGIDTTELKSWASGKLAEIKAKHSL